MRLILMTTKTGKRQFYADPERSLIISPDCLIRLDGLCLQASIGIYAHEQAYQPLEIDLSLTINGELAAHSDNICHTVDYDEVVELLEDLLANRHFNLLEHLSQVILDLLGQRFPIKRAEITLAKPLAVPKARRVSISRQAEWPPVNNFPVMQQNTTDLITGETTTYHTTQTGLHSHTHIAGFIP